MRHRAGLTQAKLAEKSGLDRTHISKVERGHDVGSVDFYRRFFAACGYALAPIEMSETVTIVFRSDLSADRAAVLEDLGVLLPHLPQDTFEDLRLLVAGWKARYAADLGG